MVYEPLHHKYRPQTFAHLVGQGAIATTLVNALRQERIAPAYLFAGPRGTGKTSSARILAKSLNCLSHDRPTEAPCGHCEVCKAIAQGTALDVIEIDAASNTGVDNIRELIERAQFAPVQCRHKVYIIDECHMLSNAAFNSLLKTLEEPPDHVVFVLATTDPQRVLPTIISRCQRFDFRRIPLDAMIEHLTYIAAEEQIEIEPEAIALVAQIAQGGLRDAESLLDQLSLLPEGVSVDAVWDLVGAVPERDLMALLEAIAANHPQAVLDCARRLMDRGREPQIVLQNLASFYRDFLIAKTAPNRPDLVALTEPTWQRLCEFAQRFELGAILHGQQHLKSSESQLRHSTQPRLWLEVTLMGLLPTQVAPAQVVTTAAIAAQPIPAAPAPTSPSSVTPSPVPAPQPQSQPVAPRPAIAGTAPSITAILTQLNEKAWLGWDAELIESIDQAISFEARSNPEFVPQLIAALGAIATSATSISATSTPATSTPAIATPATPAPPPPAAQSHPSPTPMSTPHIPAAAGHTPVPATPTAVNPSPDLEATWQQVLGAIAQPSTKALFQQMVRLVGFDGKTATAGTSIEWVKKFEKSEDNRRKLLTEAFQQTFQRPIAVKFVVMATPAKGETEDQEESDGRSRPSRPHARDPGRSPPTRDHPPQPPPTTPPTGISTVATSPVAPSAVAMPSPAAPSPAAPSAVTTLAVTTSAVTTSPLAPSPPNPSTELAPTPSPQFNHSSPSSPTAPLPPHPNPTSAPTPPALNSALSDDDVTRSAKSFANFFNGEVVAAEGGDLLEI
jgi:DNA polymerase-3 subunit gamma/tau